MRRVRTTLLLAGMAVALCAACAEPTVTAVSSSDAGVVYDVDSGDLIPPTRLADAHCARMGRLANLTDVSDSGMSSQRVSFECR